MRKERKRDTFICMEIVVAKQNFTGIYIDGAVELNRGFIFRLALLSFCVTVIIDF